jgi:hypothetical protein
MLRITRKEALEIYQRFLSYHEGETIHDDLAFAINEWLERKEKEEQSGKVPD